MPLFGAHHHPLMMMHDPDRCAWVSIDAAQFEVGETGHLLNEEVGICHAFMNRKLYVGLGFGLNQLHREGYLDGEQELDGQYGLFEVNYRANKSAPIFGFISMYGHWNAEVNRAYLNAGNRDISKGKTDVEAGAIKLSVNWPKMTEIGSVHLSPKASYTVSHTEIDAYTETGGGFPARFDERNANSQQVRVGVDIEKTFNKGATTFRTILEAVHQFNRNGTGVSGELLGLNEFNNEMTQVNRYWGRAGLELGHDFGHGKRLLLTGFAASAGGDPEMTAAANFSFSF